MCSYYLFPEGYGLYMEYRDDMVDAFLLPVRKREKFVRATTMYGKNGNRQ